MEQEIKFFIYVGGVIVAILSGWFAIKYQSRQNQKDIDKINMDVSTSFKKLDITNIRIIEIEKQASHFLTREDIENTHPTKRELDLHLEQLHKSDETINNDIKSLKKEINNKLDKIMDILLSRGEHQ